VLRRTQAIKLEGDDVSAMRAEIERAFTPNPELRDPTQLPPEIDRPFSRADIRNPDTRPRVRASWGIGPSRIALIMVAVVAGGIAAYLSLQSNQPAPAPTTQVVTEVVPEPSVQVLVAKDAIGVGQRLSSASVEWADWPEGSVRAEFITNEAMPDAATFMAGSVARYEFFPGEPIREEKLAQPGDGYLSVVLDSGLRGVAVAVTPESASGGFILPNDYVDVVLTRPTEFGQDTKTILTNVRVLAIGDRLGGTKPQAEEQPEDEKAGFSEEAVATLALDPVQAEIIVSAASLGKLTLILRSMTDATAGEAALSPANQAIRISSPFWTR
jgi:pilus assembly protein CpaB